MKTKVMPQTVSPERRIYRLTLEEATKALAEFARTQGEEVPLGKMYIWQHDRPDDPHVLTLVVDCAAKKSE